MRTLLLLLASVLQQTRSAENAIRVERDSFRHVNRKWHSAASLVLLVCLRANFSITSLSPNTKAIAISAHSLQIIIRNAVLSGEHFFIACILTAGNLHGERSTHMRQTINLAATKAVACHPIPQRRAHFNELAKFLLLFFLRLESTYPRSFQGCEHLLYMQCKQ
jgi:hypothetical protein